MIKDIKKVVGFFLLAALVLGACKGKDRIELRVLNYYDTTSAGAAEELKEVWEAFEKANPDIKIVRDDLFNDPFHERVQSYVTSHELPDVMYAWPSGRSTALHAKHLLKDLGPLVRLDGIGSGYTAVSLDPSGQASGYMGILSRAITATNAFYINLEVLKECGLEPAASYAELKAQVPVLKAKGYETILMANKETWVMQSCLFSLVAGRFCGEGWEHRVIFGDAAFTDPDFTAALEFIKTMYDDGVLSQNTLSTDYGAVVQQFAENKGAYYIDGDWRVAAFVTEKSSGKALIPPDKQKNIRITVFPDIEGALFNRSDSVVLGTGWGISAAIPPGSRREEAAWRLVKWLAGKEIQTWLLETGGIATPTRNDIDVGSLKLEPMQIALGNLSREYDKSTVVIDGAFDASVYAPINDGLLAIGKGTMSPGDVAAAAQAALEKWKEAQ